MKQFLLATMSLLFFNFAWANDEYANNISKRIENEFLAYGTVAAPFYESWESDNIVSYTHAADSAMWTGVLLAAESYRYRVTNDSNALVLVKKIVDALDLLSSETGTGVMARYVLPSEGLGVKEILSEEAHNKFHPAMSGNGRQWMGNTSRDMYVGAFFGLGVAYEMVDDDSVRTQVRSTVTRMLNFLLKNGWTIRMPGGGRGLTVPNFKWNFYHRVGLLQIGKLVNPQEFAKEYEKKKNPGLIDKIAIRISELDGNDPHKNYYRFNLGALTFYNLIHYESDGKVRSNNVKAYERMRRIVETHRNAHFNMIDRVLMGVDVQRDQDIPVILTECVARPQREGWHDYSDRYPVCGGTKEEPTSCEPLPIVDRVLTDFLWQRSPFQLRGGGDNRIGVAGLDYLLPYWMARYYGIIN